MRLTDLLWFCLLAAVLACVGWIGTTMVTQTIQTTAAIENVYRVRDWAESKGPHAKGTQSEEGSGPVACRPPDGSLADCANWVEAHPPVNKTEAKVCESRSATIRSCLQELVSQDGALKDLRNPFEAKDPVWTSVCSAETPQSLGGIMVLVGKPKSATDQALEYKPLKHQTLESATSIRMIVCGRLYRPSAPIDFQI